MSESPNSLSQRRHPYLPGLWLAAGFLGLASVAFLIRPFGVTPHTVTESAAKIRIEKLKKAKEEQEKLSATYGWVDKDKGIAHIPIEQAMKLTTATLRKIAPHPDILITTIQPSAISAAGFPLYPEIPIAEVPAVPATTPLNAITKMTSSQPTTNTPASTNSVPSLPLNPTTKKP